MFKCKCKTFGFLSICFFSPESLIFYYFLVLSLLLCLVSFVFFFLLISPDWFQRLWLSVLQGLVVCVKAVEFLVHSADFPFESFGLIELLAFNTPVIVVLPSNPFRIKRTIHHSWAESSKQGKTDHISKDTSWKLRHGTDKWMQISESTTMSFLVLLIPSYSCSIRSISRLRWLNFFA